MDYHGWVGTHKCPPRWIVRFPDYEWETTVYAISAVAAAEKATEEYEVGDTDYWIASGKDTATVEVEDPDGKIARFEVSGEVVPRYFATEIEDTP